MGFELRMAVIGIVILTYIFETYLHLLQHAALKQLTLPEHLKPLVKNEKFERARAYGLHRSNSKFAHEAATVLIKTTVLLYNFLPWFWKRSGDILGHFGLDVENEIFHTVAFIPSYTIFSKIIDLSSTLVTCYDFRKQKLMHLFEDMLKEISLFSAFVVAAIYIQEIGGPYSTIYLLTFMVCQSIFVMLLAPVLLDPLFNKFTLLPDGVLREKIENLASSLKFPLNRLYVVDGSTRSCYSNAYVDGVFKGVRIVLYDTLIQQHENEEIVAVIAHELGHWKLNHNSYMSITYLLFQSLYFGGYIFVRNWTDMFRSFGFETQPLLIGFIIYQYALLPFQHLVTFGLNLVQRSFEFQADAFASKLGYSSALRAVIIKKQVENMLAINTDAWYSAFYHSHPPLGERLAALNENP